MKGSDLSKQLPTALALVERVRQHRRRRTRRRRVVQAGWFGVGLAIGSGVAVLVAPRRGAVTRRRIRVGMDRARDYVMGPKSKDRQAVEGPTH